MEFQLRRAVLRQMGVHSLDDLRSKISGIWKYLTHDWSRFTACPFDRNNRHQNRAVLHHWWEEDVQNVDWGAELVTVFRKKKVPTRNIEHLLDLVTGCSISLATINGFKAEDLGRFRRCYRECSGLRGSPVAFSSRFEKEIRCF